MRINHNVSSIATQGSLSSANREVSKSSERLSTGLRINRANDDAAGLSISEGMRAQVKGTGQARKNAQDGISLLNVAEGAANEVSSILQRMRELALKSSTDTLTNVERVYTDTEFGLLRDEIDRISDVTNYNGQSLISNGTGSEGRFGAGGTGSVLWVDSNDQSGKDSLTVMLDTLSSDSSGLKIINESLLSQTAAKMAISAVDGAIGSVNTMRSTVGALVGRLEGTINNLITKNTSSQSAESQIRDVDFALESSLFSKSQIISQSATAMLSQANQSSQGVMSLLR